jgi:hypothetical protein
MRQICAKKIKMIYKKMKQKIKIYRMSLSRVFPAKHPRAGECTYFHKKLCKTLCVLTAENCNEKVWQLVRNGKLHTIRANYPLWKKRIDEVTGGKAVLVIYQWNGKPYSADGNTNLFIFGTSAVKDFIDELMELEKYQSALPILDSGLGVQKALFIPELQIVAVGNEEEGEVHSTGYSEIATNDGLSLVDFKAWFQDYDLNKPMAIIQLTNFRY